MMVSVYAAAYIRFAGDSSAVEDYIGPLFGRALVFAAVMISSMVAFGLYQARLREGMAGVMLRTAVSFIFGGMILAVLFYLFPILFLGRGASALAGILSFFVIGTIRPVFFDSVDEQLLKRRVLVFGAGERAASITRRLRRRSDQRSFAILGFVHVSGQHDVVQPENIIKLESRLLDFAAEHEIDEIVVAVDDRRKGFPLDELLDCKMSGIDVIDVLTFFEREAGKVRVDMLNPSWLVFSDGFQRGTFKDSAKRAFDMAASLLLLAIIWPVMLLTALAISLEDGWDKPVFYKQVRAGQYENAFQVLKFRSMTVDAESDGKARWAEIDDSRVTRVGAFIRKVRIDELPQIFNVLKGDMSFVGPRPERPEFVQELSQVIPYYSERHRVKPGITGWAQLCYPYGSSEEDAKEKQQYDLYYVKNHGLFLDMLILLQTVEVVLFGKGAR
jgi:sugar transferase (PEP-CTERM system associated)